jgi:hypothetical protein
MAPNRYYASSAQPTVLSAAITSTSATTFTIPSSPASLGWPSSVPYTVLVDWGTLSAEAMTVTASSGSGPYTLTVTRGVDGTTAATHAVTTYSNVFHGVSAQDFAEPQAHMAATSGVHGLTGSVVGTSDAQTLTNKTLGSGTVLPFDTTASDFQPAGKPAAGATGKAADAGHVHPPTYEMLPTGALAQTGPRPAASSAATLNNGYLYATTIYLAAGTVVTNIDWAASTASASSSHWYFSLLNASYQVLANTADQLTANTSTNAVNTLALTSPYTITTTGWYFISHCMTATTLWKPITVWNSLGFGTAVGNISPALGFYLSSGMTTPPTLGSTLSGMSFATYMFYGYVS